MGIRGGHPQQINVGVEGQVLDIASISPIVASAASFKIHRIYYDDSKFERADALKRSIRDLVTAHLTEMES